MQIYIKKKKKDLLQKLGLSQTFDRKGKLNTFLQFHQSQSVLNSLLMTWVIFELKMLNIQKDFTI